MKNLERVLFIFVLLFFSAGVSIQAKESFGLTSKILKGFQLLTIDESPDGAAFEYKHDQELLRIENINGLDKHSANILINDDILSIRAIYANSFSPYPGDLSNEIVCNEVYQPTYHEQSIEKIFFRYVKLYSTQRLGLGACNIDNIKYRHLIGWIYCEKRQELNTVRYYIPIEQNEKSLEDFILSFRCL